MAQVSITLDMVNARAAVADLAASVPFYAAHALTKAGEDAKAAALAEMPKVFDRPTRWTLSSLRLKTATKDDLVAVIDFKDFGGTPAWKYLGPEIEGGPRKKKSHERALERAGILRAGEFAVPAKNFPLDAYGNMPGSVITRILSGLAASPDAFQNWTQRSRRRQAKRGAARYFVLRGSRAPDGIYERAPGSRAANAIILFVRPPQYRSRYPFFALVTNAARATFERHFWDAYRRWPPKRASRAA